MALMLKRPENAQYHPEGWEPDHGPYIEIDRDIGRGIGNIAIVGSFESESFPARSRKGDEVAEKLSTHGIIGMNKVLGIRTITNYANSHPQDYELATQHGLDGTMRGLYDAVLRRKYIDTNGDDPLKNQTRMLDKWFEPLNIRLFGDPITDRFQVNDGIFQAWEDFNRAVDRSVMSDSTVKDRSLIVVAAASIAPHLGEHITQNHLLYGKVVYLHESDNGSHWVPEEELGETAEARLARQKMVRTGAFAPLTRDPRARILRMTSAVRDVLRNRER